MGTCILLHGNQQPPPGFVCFGALRITFHPSIVTMDSSNGFLDSDWLRGSHRNLGCARRLFSYAQHSFHFRPPSQSHRTSLVVSRCPNTLRTPSAFRTLPSRSEDARSRPGPRSVIDSPHSVTIRVSCPSSKSPYEPPALYSTWLYRRHLGLCLRPWIPNIRPIPLFLAWIYVLYGLPDLGKRSAAHTRLFIWSLGPCPCRFGGILGGVTWVVGAISGLPLAFLL